MLIRKMKLVFYLLELADRNILLILIMVILFMKNAQIYRKLR